MKRSRLIGNSLRCYWRTNLAIALGMAVGTAVLAGALIVGDSIRGSMKRMTLERLGAVDYALVAQQFFGEELARDLGESSGFTEQFASATPAILLQGSIENAQSSELARGINVFGVDARFWDLASGDGAAAITLPQEHRLILNAKLAEQIGIENGGEGQDVLIRLVKPDPIPGEAIHGRRTRNTVTIRLAVDGVIADQGLGRFGLIPSQQLPLNVYVEMETLQQRLDRAGEVNAILVSAKDEPREPEDDQSEILQTLLGRSVSLANLQLRLRSNASPGYLSLESTRMVLQQGEIDAAEAAARDLDISFAPTLTYLANSIAAGESEIPYSTVTALDPSAPAPFGPLTLIDGSQPPRLGERDILLNSWAADDLGAALGDSIRISYYTEGPEGQFETDAATDFILRGVVAMEGAGGDAGLTPEYPGIHDAESVRDWDPPFPIDLTKVRDVDEEYWKEHGATPKGFIALQTGQELWKSRFGRLTSIRFSAAEGRSLEQTKGDLAEKIRSHLSPASAGLRFQPSKIQGLRASKGASDFGMLFIGFSFFIIVAAMLLVRLLFSLGVELRSKEIGLLLASGYNGADVRRLFLTEGAVLACAGGVAGLALGVAYAAVMLLGLRTWWVGSIGTTFLWLHVTPLSLLIGFVAGVAAGLGSAYWAVRSLVRVDPSRLLAGGSGLASLPLTPARMERARRRDRMIAMAAAVIGGGSVFS
ncbi:ABC transporter permease, partial [Candidatus Sumerlaeota bacterium]|nr:ABC transporter permease [Candidatus Sumerlaeota bacterium]